MAEDVAADVVAAKLKDVKAAFGDLEVAHDAYTDSLEAEADILKSEAWYNSAQQNSGEVSQWLDKVERG